MKAKLLVKSLVLAAAFSVAAAAGAARAQEKVVRIDGSSTVYPVTEAVAEEFQKEHQDTKVTVGISGTGGGFKKFVRGEIDIADASRPILAKEMEEAKRNGIEYYELPVAFDALTVVVNPQNNWLERITVNELKTMWAPDAQGKITTWNQVNPSWPDAPLKLFGPGADSGTFDYFTEAVVGKSKSSRGDFTASEDDNVLVQGVAGDPNALGYFGYAYFVENKDKLKAVPVVNPGTSDPVSPSHEAVLDGSYQPLSRPIFIYVNKQAYQTRREVKAFVEYYLNNGADLAEEVRYVPLPDSAYTKGLERVRQGNSGTAFAGHADVGVQIDELFQRQLTRDPKMADAK